MDIINFKNKPFNVIKKMKNNKLLVSFKDKKYILVPFDTYSAFSSYLTNKKNLKKNKVEMSRIIKKDKKGLLLLEEFIEGENVASIIANNTFEKKHYTELFRIYRNNRFAKIALSYRPENFILHKKNFYYLSDDIFNYNPKNAFELTDDFLLWLNTNEQKEYIEKLGYRYQDRELIKDNAHLNKQIALTCVSFW